MKWMSTPFWVFERVVQPRLGHCPQALHEGVDLVQLRVRQLDEGLPIQGIWDGLRFGRQAPLAIHCKHR